VPELHSKIIEKVKENFLKSLPFGIRYIFTQIKEEYYY